MTHEIPLTFQTNYGRMRVLLDPMHAPETVDNFLGYVDRKHYDGTVFHRVVRNYILQGGAYDLRYSKLPVGKPIRNEADNGLKNMRGSLAMARASDPSSATAQFFINVMDNPFLDHKGPQPYDFGYAVFGRVIEGLNVVDRIRCVPTGPHLPLRKDVPLDPVLIESVRRA